MSQEPRGRFPNYWVYLTQPTQDIEIIADLPEEFSISASSHYEGPTGTMGAGGSNIAAGGDIAMQYLTKRVWAGTEPLSFPLKLLFDAENNTYEDVHETLNLLLSMALPSNLDNLPSFASGWGISASSVLVSPNPYREYTGFSEHNKISLRIGRQYFFESVVVMSANLVSDTRLIDTGYPLAGAIDLQICTDYVLHKKDLFKAAGIRGNALPANTSTRAPMADDPGLSPVQLLRMREG